MIETTRTAPMNANATLDGSWKSKSCGIACDGNPVEIMLNDGTVFSGWGMVRGGPENSTTRDDIVEKFGKLTSRVLDAKVRSRLIERCDALETPEDATALIEGLEWARLS